MAKIGFSEAARLAGVSRQHLYRMADAGEISVIKELLPGKTGEHPKDFKQLIDVSELQRVFSGLTGKVTPNVTQWTVVDTSCDSSDRSLDTVDTSDYSRLEAELIAAKQLLRDKEEQLKKAEEREEWLRKQVDETQNVVKLLGHSRPVEVDEADYVPVVEFDKAVDAVKKLKAEREKSNIERNKEVVRLEAELAREKNKGFFARLFGK